MEREILITGIGGQGVQLAAQVLARAAMLEGRDVMLFGIYGGMMRGGNTDATVVVADGPIAAPPVVSRAWSAIAMHDEFWAPVRREAAAAARVVLVNATLFEAPLDREALARGRRAGHASRGASSATRSAASMVMVGAYARSPALVGARRARRGDARRRSRRTAGSTSRRTSARCAPAATSAADAAAPAWPPRRRA